MAMNNRHLNWPGCYNARDLGGLPSTDGLYTRQRAIVRSDCLDLLSEAGWSSLQEYGIRTIVDLRNDAECQGEVRYVNPFPQAVTVVRLNHDGFEDTEFWSAFERGPQFASTPEYYKPHLERMPERSACVLQAIAQARPGGVLFHCVHGRDRTGFIAILLLALLDVHVEHIVSDYEASDERLLSRYQRTGKRDPGKSIEEYLARKGTTAANLIIDLLKTCDLKRHLEKGGLTGSDLDTLQRRFLTHHREADCI
jgi:protein-tyrosine phosphatase